MPRFTAYQAFWFGGPATRVVFPVSALQCVVDTSYQPACGVVCWGWHGKERFGNTFYHEIYLDIVKEAISISVDDLIVFSGQDPTVDRGWWLMH